MRAKPHLGRRCNPDPQSTSARPMPRPSIYAIAGNANLTLGTRPISSCPRKRAPRACPWHEQGATETASVALAPRFRGGDEESKMDTICSVRATSILAANADERPKGFELAATVNQCSSEIAHSHTRQHHDNRLFLKLTGHALRSISPCIQHTIHCAACLRLNVSTAALNPVTACICVGIADPFAHRLGRFFGDTRLRCRRWRQFPSGFLL